MTEKMKILIAYDGSLCADAALADLARAGLPKEAEAMVVTVTEVWLPPPSSYEIIEAPFAEVTAVAGMAREQHQQQIEAAHAVAFQAARRLEAVFPNWQVRPEARTGSPATVILKLADEWPADLIVAGSHGHSAIGRLFLGSVSYRLITHAHCSVRIARDCPREADGPLRLLIGVDGSHGAQETVRALAARSWPEGTEARIVAVYDALAPTAIGQFIPPVVAVANESNYEERTWIREMVEVCARELRRAGLVVSPAILPGDPRRALIEEADQWQADCIFVGARGLSQLDRFLLGSVSAAVASRAHCSVEIIRTKASA